MDFFFGFEPYARKLTDFLQTMVPMRFNTSKKLISHDGKSNTYNYKYVFRWAFAHFYLYLDTALKTESISSRWVSVVEFYDPTLGIGKVFGQESTVVKWNYQLLSLHLVTVCQKVPISDFQSEFSVSKIIRIFLKKIIEEYQFKRTFFVKSIFCWLWFLNHFITKMPPNFWLTVTWWRPKIW